VNTKLIFTAKKCFSHSVFLSRFPSFFDQDAFTKVVKCLVFWGNVSKLSESLLKSRKIFF